jgi:hypothetical protein
LARHQKPGFTDLDQHQPFLRSDHHAADDASNLPARWSGHPASQGPREQRDCRQHHCEREDDLQEARHGNRTGGGAVGRLGNRG